MTHPLHDVTDHQAPLLVAQANGPSLDTADGGRSSMASRVCGTLTSATAGKSSRRHPGHVRGLSMMCGIELVADKARNAPALGLGAKEALARGLLVRIRAGGAEPPVQG